MNKLSYLLFALLLVSCAAQKETKKVSTKEIDVALKAELDEILYSDQELRRLLTPD